MPTEGDFLRVAVKWLDPDQHEVFNIFHYALDTVNVNTWEAVGDEIKTWLEVGYNPWMARVATDWVGLSFEILVRDVIAGQWNQVYSDTFDTLGGEALGGSLPALSTATFVSYPGAVRHWGFKNLPAPHDDDATAGRITAAALVDLLLTAVLLSTGVIGSDAILRVGVYALATETFRGFTGSVAASNVIGSRVTRKVGRGI